MGIHDDCGAGAGVRCKPDEFTPDAKQRPLSGRMLTDLQASRAAETAYLFAGQTLIDQPRRSQGHLEGLHAGPARRPQNGGILAIRRPGKVVATLYVQKHNPFVYFSRFADDPDRTAKLLPDDGLPADLQGGFARFTWISPDLCHEMPGIPPEPAAAIGLPECGYSRSGLDHSVIRLGDDYLRETIGAIRASPAWKDDTAIIIVSDEDNL